MSIAILGSAFVGTVGVFLGFQEEKKCRKALDEHIKPFGELKGLEGNSLAARTAKKAFSFFSEIPSGFLGGILGGVCSLPLIGKLTFDKYKESSLHSKRDSLAETLASCNRELTLCPKAKNGGFKVEELIQAREKQIARIVDDWALPVDREATWQEQWVATQSKKLFSVVVEVLKKRFLMSNSQGLVDLMQIGLRRFAREVKKEATSKECQKVCEKIAEPLLKEAFSFRLFAFAYQVPYIGALLEVIDELLIHVILYPVWKIGARIVTAALFPKIEKLLSPENIRSLYLRGVDEIKQIIRDREDPENPLVSLREKEDLEMAAQSFLGVLYDEVSFKELIPFSGDKSAVKKTALLLKNRGELQGTSEEAMEDLIEKVMAQRDTSECKKFTGEEKIIDKIIDSKIKEQVVSRGGHFLASKLLKAIYFEGEVEVERLLLSFLTPSQALEKNKPSAKKGEFLEEQQRALRELQEEVFCCAFAKDPELEEEIFLTEKRAIIKESEDFLAEMKKADLLPESFEETLQERATALAHLVSKCNWASLKVKEMAGEEAFLSGLIQLSQNIKQQIGTLVALQGYKLVQRKEMYERWHALLYGKKEALSEFQELSAKLFPEDIELQEDAESIFLASKKEKAEVLSDFITEVEQMYQKEQQEVEALEKTQKKSLEHFQEIVSNKEFLAASFQASAFAVSREGAISFGRQMVEELPKEKRKAFSLGIDKLLGSEQLAKGALLSLLKAVSYRV